MRHLSTDLRRRSGQSSASSFGGTRGGRRWLPTLAPLSRRSASSASVPIETPRSCEDNEAGALLPVRLRHPHLTPLFYDVRNRDWPAVIRRCQTRPHEAWVQEDISGETLLHCAARFDPPAEVVRSLLEAAINVIEEGSAVANTSSVASPQSRNEAARNVVEDGFHRGGDGLIVGSEVVRGVRNAEGATALHVACSHRASEACIRVLTSEACIRALTKTGRIPLHYACMSFRGLDVEAFRTLLEATVADRATISAPPHVAVASSIDCKPSAVEDLCLDPEFDCEEEEKDRQHAPANADLLTLRDSTDQAPLGLLFRRYRERVRCVIKLVEQSTVTRDQASPSNSSSTASPNSTNAAATAVRADLGELWEKARLIVSTMAEQQGQEEQEQQHEDQSWHEGEEDNEAFQQGVLAPDCNLPLKSLSAFPAQQTRKFRIVHASVGLTGYGCPPEMVRLAASVHPNQVREMDEEGNLPIHIIAAASSYAHPDAEAPELGGGACGDDEASLSSIAAGSVASTALSVYTCATSAANSLGTSQFCAPHNPRPFDAVIRILLRHHPEGAAIPHGSTGELPLAIAARTGKRTWDDGMKTLLLAYPPALYGPELHPPGLHAYILGRVASKGRVGNSNDLVLPVGVTGRDTTTFGPVGYGRRQRRMRSRNKAAAKALGAVFDLVKAQPNAISRG